MTAKNFDLISGETRSERSKLNCIFVNQENAGGSASGFGKIVSFKETNRNKKKKQN